MLYLYLFVFLFKKESKYESVWTLCSWTVWSQHQYPYRQCNSMQDFYNTGKALSLFKLSVGDNNLIMVVRAVMDEILKSAVFSRNNMLNLSKAFRVLGNGCGLLVLYSHKA